MYLATEFIAILVIPPYKRGHCIGSSYVVRMWRSHVIMCDLAALLESLPVGSRVEIHQSGETCGNVPAWTFIRPKGEWRT